MPELHMHHEGEQLEITFGSHRSTIAWADIESWTPEYVRDNAAAYGHKLFEQITQNTDLRDALTRLRKNTRLVLVAEQSEVAAIPWEYLRLPETSGNLLLATRYNLVRGIPEGQRQDSVALDGGLRIVAVPVSAVNELVPLNTEGEWKNLSETVKAYGKAVTLQRVRPPTLSAMGRALNGEGTAIVQFMGHSNSVDGNGVLVFEDELGRAKVITSAQFANTLNERTLLVVLNSCYSATAQGIVGGAESVGAVSALGNIARLVVHEEVPYALGMQFALPDVAALAITNALYDALLQGRNVEEAVRSLRASLENNALLQNTKWLAGVPVLYTSLREPAPALKLETGQPTLIPDPVRLTQTFDLSALSTPQHFFGRADAISETLEALQDTSKRGFVVLHGLGGIGKTTLARVVATRISWHYQDRVLAYSFETFARFAFEGDSTRITVDTEFAARFYNKLATFYGLDSAKYTETRDLQNAILQQRTHIRSLLILDNIETLVYAQKQKDENARSLAVFIRDLQHGEGDILLTTREMPPNDWGERKEVHLLGLNDEAGAKLFLASIALDRKDAALKEDRIALSQSVYGHPLCIRLLAGRFSEDKAGGLATFRKNLLGELGRARQTTPTSTDDPTRQETFDNCIAYSVRRLSPELEKVLYTIGIFRAPFLLKYAKAVLNDEESITEKYLQDLVRLGLLERTLFDLYELHPMLRLHIKSNIEALDVEKRQRYGEVYEVLARQAYEPLSGYDSSPTTRYLLHQSLPDCEAALVEDDIDLTTRSAIAYHLAEPYIRMGQVKHALALYEQALKICEELGDVHKIAVTQSAMADVLVRQGRVTEAMELYKQSLTTHKELGDMREMSATQSAMANILVQQGRVIEAIELYEQSLKMYQVLGDVRGIAVTQSAMVNVLVQQGRVTEAMELCEQSLKTYQELGDVRSIAVTQHMLADMLVQQGRVGEAMELYEQSLKAKQELGDMREIAVTQSATANVLVQQGRVTEAIELHKQSLTTYEELGDMREIAVTQRAMANILVQQGRVTEAMELCEQSLKTYQELGDVRGIATAHTAMASVLVQQGRVGEAMELYEQSLKTYQELRDVRGIAVTQNAIANVLRQQGRVTEVMELYEQVLSAGEELGNVQGIAIARTNVGSLLWQQGEYIKALAMVWQAYKSLPERDFLPDSQAIQGFLVSFKKRFSGEEQAFDALWQQATSEPQPAWLYDVQVGLSANNVTLTEEEVAEIGEAVTAFVNAENRDATQQVVEARQEILFRPETEFVFEQFIEQAKASGEQRVVELLEMHLAVLRECKANGIAATFERLRAMGQGEE